MANHHYLSTSRALEEKAKIILICVKASMPSDPEHLSEEAFIKYYCPGRSTDFLKHLQGIMTH